MSEVSVSLVAGKQITKAVSLLEPLSSGGMGAVWLADHATLKTRVVVKFMLGGLDASDSARVRFSREAAAAAQVKSPHVVQMLDHGVTDDGIPFIVMEHLEGHDLGDEIEQHGPLDPSKVVTVVTQVAKALSKVHAAGFLHRDIKPDNIFLCDGEEDVFVKLLDFGIAKSSSVEEDGSLDGQTKTGQVVGTPFYMSPEQVTAQKVIDLRSDLWALGVVAYEALTGQRPYDGPSFGALAVKIATGSPPRPTEANPSLPAALDAWFAKACAREPGGRFSSAKEMADAFRAVFAGVVRLPSSGVANGDSGERGRSSSSGSPSAESGSDARSRSRQVSPSFALATTKLDDFASSSKDRVALGRSEAGVSVAGDSRSADPRSSRTLYVGGAIALSVAVGIVLITTFRAQPHGVASAKSATSRLAAQAGSAPRTGGIKTARKTSAIASAYAIAAETSNTPSTMESTASVVDGSAPAPTPTGAPTVSHAPGQMGRVNGSTFAVPSTRSGDAPPTPTAIPKPVDSAPDL